MVFSYHELALHLRQNNNTMIFSRNNYLIMLAGIALLVIGFVIMTMEKAEYGFGPLGLTVGPAFLMVGFLVEIYAILHKDKAKGE